MSPKYFNTMGIRLRGREFTAADTGDAQMVTIVSESMARQYWPNEDPIGKSVILASASDKPQTVIGVAGDVRNLGLDATPNPMVYFPTPEAPAWNPMTIVIRTAGEPSSVTPSARAVLRAIDPTVPFYNVTAVDRLIDDSRGPRRFTVFLVTCFASIALVLACVGLFGVMVYLVTQRAREIAIRLALGARPGVVFRSVIGRGLALAAIGAALGVATAYWLTPLMQSFLFQVDPVDLITFVAAPLTLIAIGVLACYLPARRAMSVDPLVALREE